MIPGVSEQEKGGNKLDYYLEAQEQSLLTVVGTEEHFN